MEYMKIMFHQIKNINKETKIIEKKLNKNSGVEKIKKWTQSQKMWDTIKCTIIYTLGGIERSRKKCRNK